MQEIQAAGLQILVWTVNEKEAMLRLAEWGVDGIISDDTELLVAYTWLIAVEPQEASTASWAKTRNDSDA